MRSLPPGPAPAKDWGWTSQHPRDVAQSLAKSHAITSHEPKSSASCRERHHCMRPHGHSPNTKGTHSPVSRACSCACRGLAAASLKGAAQASLSLSLPHSPLLEANAVPVLVNCNRGAASRSVHREVRGQGSMAGKILKQEDSLGRIPGCWLHQPHLISLSSQVTQRAGRAGVGWVRFQEQCLRSTAKQDTDGVAL